MVDACYFICLLTFSIHTCCFGRTIFIYPYILMLKGGKPKCNMNEKSNANDYVSEETAKSHPPLIAKWRNGVKLQLPGKFDGEGKLYTIVRE